MESLDDRVLLSGGAQAATAQVLGDRPPSPLPINLSLPLRSVYREHADQVRDSGSTPGQPGDALVSIRGVRVAVRIKVAFPPALDAYVRDLRADGMKVIRIVPNFGLAEGTVPVAKLPAVAQIAAHVWPTTLPGKT